MSVRMMVLAESHRKKMREYNNIKTNRTADSMRFIFILIITFIISTIIPGTVRFKTGRPPSGLGAETVQIWQILQKLYYVIL